MIFESLTKARSFALEQLDALALPTIERTNYDHWHLFNSEVALPYYDTIEWIPSDSEDYSAQMIISDDHIQIHYTPQFEEAGIEIKSLAEVLSEKHPLQSAFGSIIPVNMDKIVADNMAHLSVGWVINVPKNVVLEKPLLVQLDLDAAQTFNGRQLLNLGENCHINLIEQLETTATCENVSWVSEVVTHTGAQINYCGLDALHQETTGFIKRYADAQRDVRIDWSIGTFNDGNVILDLDTYLTGEGSDSEVAIVGIATGKQEQIVDSKVVNWAPHSVANILQHGVIFDEARMTFNGIGKLERGAKGADAQQESRLLMLTEYGRGDANPILLIEEFEVTAGHAASVGQVDPEQMYYLMSRGITRPVAEFMVVRGFLGPVLLKMPSATIREACLALIDQKLAQNFTDMTDSESGEIHELLS